LGGEGKILHKMKKDTLLRVFSLVWGG